MNITREMLIAVGASPARAEEVLQPLQEAALLYGILERPERVAAFLSQTGHESEGFKYSSEIWGPSAQQKRYERDPHEPWPAHDGEVELTKFARNRLAYRLGNVNAGDGSAYRGHGFIQITGRYNHRKAAERMKAKFGPRVPDFELQPSTLSELQWAALSAADYWDWKGLNALADQGDFAGITRRINGGTNGLPDRIARWKRVSVLTGQPQELPPVEELSQPADPRGGARDKARELNRPPVPAEQMAIVPPEKPMAPFVMAVLPSLIELVPKLAGMFGSGSKSSERNIAAASAVVEVAKQAIGARNEQELQETIAADPEAAVTVRKAIEQNWFAISGTTETVKEAREMNVAIATSSLPLMRQPAFLITVFILVIVSAVVALVLWPGGGFSDEIQAMVVQAVVMGAFAVAVQFWLGSSFGSLKKTEIAAQRGEQL